MAQRNVGDPRHGERLAIVQALKLGELFQVLFDQVGELPYFAAAFGGAHLRPGIAFESLTRSFHGAIDVFAIALGDLRHHFSGCRIVGGKSFARRRIQPICHR